MNHRSFPFSSRHLAGRLTTLGFNLDVYVAIELTPTQVIEHISFVTELSLAIPIVSESTASKS